MGLLSFVHLSPFLILDAAAKIQMPWIKIGSHDIAVTPREGKTVADFITKHKQQHYDF